MASCLFCNKHAVITRQDNSSRTIYNCVSCGVYVVSDLVTDLIDAHIGEVKAYMRHRYIAGNRETLLISFEKAKLDKDYLQMTVDQIVDLYPKSFSEQMEMALYNLALLSRYPGDEIRIETLESGPLFYLKHDSFESLSFIIKAMTKKELIDVIYYGTSFFPCGVIVSAKGWDAVSGGDKNRANTRSRALLLYNSKGETAEVVKSAAQKAAKDCKVQMFTSCMLAKEGVPIGAELTANIKASDIILIELGTEQPENYYTLGFARALGAKMFMFCNEKNREKMRTDPGWMSVIFWRDEKNLQLEICNFIKACE